MANKRPDGDGLVRKRSGGRWEGRIVVGHKEDGKPIYYQLNDHFWEGKYSPRDAHGKRISRNVYAKTREECEEKLAAMIEEVKREIAAEKEKVHRS